LRLVTTPDVAASLVHEHANSRPPTLGAGRLICIDGPSGSGKTTLADQLVQLIPATVIHTDQLCPGWDGLRSVPAVLTALLAPLAAGLPGRYQEWDWIGDRPGGIVEVEPAPLLVIEGLGAGARELAGWTTTLVWLDADTAQRRTRGLERDGDSFREHWDRWAAAERAYFDAESVSERANLTFRTG